MARTPCTHFNPALGVKYNVVNVVNGDEVTVRVLSPKDATKYGTIRSPRNCTRGDEYFKVLFPDGSIQRVMNSLKRDRVLTEDGNYEFIGKRPNGQFIKRSTDKVMVAGQSFNENESEALEVLDEVLDTEGDFENLDVLNSLED